MYESSLFCPPARSFPVTLGDMTFYVQSYQLTGQRIFTEQAAADGETVITNCSQRARRLVLEGMWVTDTEPGSLILLLDSYLRENTSFSLDLRTMHFADCRIMKYTASEQGCEPALTCRLELLAQTPPEEVTASV
ncbi:MAG: hypothetical protein IJ512_08990 [Ruminococcus sp.]|nr:hypothetical protein [Ruminococcus sp.]